mgnify:CR=1 FL=1
MLRFTRLLTKYSRMWPDWSRSGASGADRYGSDEEEGSGDTQRRKRRTGERSVFDRFIGEFN